MSPRPPPKISLRHDWGRGEVQLGSTVDPQSEGKVVRQSEEEVARHAKFFQPTQPILKPICDRSGQPDNTPDVFVVETCPSEENKNVGVEQTHDRSGQPDKRSDAVQNDPEVHHEIKMLNIDNELIRERIEEDMDFQNSRTTTFYCEATAERQRSRLDSENREPSESTSSSTRPTTESIIKSLQSRIKTNDS